MPRFNSVWILYEKTCNIILLEHNCFLAFILVDSLTTALIRLSRVLNQNTDRLVSVSEDMIYLIQYKCLPAWVQWYLNSLPVLHFASINSGLGLGCYLFSFCVRFNRVEIFWENFRLSPVFRFEKFDLTNLSWHSMISDWLYLRSH